MPRDSRNARLVITAPMLRTGLVVCAIVSGVLLISLATLDWLAYDQFLLMLYIQ